MSFLVSYLTGLAAADVHGHFNAETHSVAAGLVHIIVLLMSVIYQQPRVASV